MSTEAIPATPVVVIKIAGDQVTVNGDVVDHEADANLYEVAIHAAAERVASALGRPVRAEAIDSETRTRLVVHPDGHASDFEVLEVFEQVAPPAESPEPVAEQVSATVARTEEPREPARTAAPEVSLADLMTPAPSAPTALAGPASDAGERGPRRRLGWLIAAAAAVLLAGSGLAAAARDGGPDEALAPPAAAPTRAPATTTPTPTRAPKARPVQRLKVSGLGVERGVELRVRAAQVPARVSVVVVQPGRPRVWVTRLVRQPSTIVRVPGLSPGVARWIVRAATAEPVSGVSSVRDTASPVPLPTYTPSPSSTPTPTPTTGTGSTSSTKPSGPKGRDDKKKPSGPVGR